MIRRVMNNEKIKLFLEWISVTFGAEIGEMSKEWWNSKIPTISNYNDDSKLLMEIISERNGEPANFNDYLSKKDMEFNSNQSQIMFFETDKELL